MKLQQAICLSVLVAAAFAMESSALAQGSSTTMLSGTGDPGDITNDSLEFAIVDCDDQGIILCSSGLLDIFLGQSSQNVAARLSDRLKPACQNGGFQVDVVGSKLKISNAERNFCCAVYDEPGNGGLVPPDRTVLGITFSKSESPGSLSFPLIFPTAAQGAGSATEITFVQSASSPQEQEVSAILFSPDGEILDTRSLVVTPHSTNSIVFEGGDSLEVGQIMTSPGVPATEVIGLSIPGVGVLPPIGVAPATPCQRPVIVLRRNSVFDTGVALAAGGQDDVHCSWTIYSGPGGTQAASGSMVVPGFGQTQFFPLSQIPSPSSFQGNIQFDCDLTVHTFSLFQRRSDGAIFANGVSCLDNNCPP